MLKSIFLTAKNEIVNQSVKYKIRPPDIHHSFSTEFYNTRMTLIVLNSNAFLKAHYEVEV